MNWDNTNNLSTSDGAREVQKKPIPLKVEFAKEFGVIDTKEGPVAHKPGAAIMTGTKGEQWPIEKDKFEATYQAIEGTQPGEAGMYFKKAAPALAKQLEESTSVTVGWSDNPIQGEPGDWIVQYGKGDFGIVGKDIFQETYEALDGQPLSEAYEKEIEEQKCDGPSM